MKEQYAQELDEKLDQFRKCCLYLHRRLSQGSSAKLLLVEIEIILDKLDALSKGLKEAYKSENLTNIQH